MANVRFKLNWKLAIFVVVFFPLTLTLGFWQLDRASQKQQLIDEHGSLVMRAPISIDAVEGVTLADYTPVKAKGTFLSEAFLLDNQVFEGQVGYEVIQPFRLTLGDILFVSRGFVVGDADRRLLPSIKTPNFLVNISGYAYQPKLNSLIDEDVQTYSDKWPVRVQSLLAVNLYTHWAKSDKLTAPFLSPSIIRLNPGSAYSFDSHWMLVNNTPEKHNAYAAQWFAMAGLLLILFVWSGFTGRQEGSNAPSNSKL